jgi:hypothetical protein
MGVTADTPTQVTMCITYSEEEIQDLLKMAQLEGYEEGYMAGMEEMEGQRYREGFEEGREVGKAEAEKLRSEETAVRVESSTQTPTTSATTVDVYTQTAPYDETPNPLSPPLSAMSSPTTVATPAATAPETTTRAAASTQTASDTSEAVNNVHSPANRVTGL